MGLLLRRRFSRQIWKVAPESLERLVDAGVAQAGARSDLTARRRSPELIRKLKPGCYDADSQKIVSSIGCPQSVLEQVSGRVSVEQLGDRIILGRIPIHGGDLLDVPCQNFRARPTLGTA
jgi:hypothetical protein